MNMIEKVVVAIQNRFNYDVQYEVLQEIAKTAIEAMREPTEEMKIIGASKPIYHCWGNSGEFTDDESAGEIYERMIDAALKED